MKTRSGFVSNSSSTSFLIVFRKKPKSWNDVKEELFNNQDGIIEYGSETKTYDEISQQLFKDIRRNSKLSESKLRAIFWYLIGNDIDECIRSKENIQYRIRRLEYLYPMMITEPLKKLLIEYSEFLKQQEVIDDSFTHIYGDDNLKDIEDDTNKYYDLVFNEYNSKRLTFNERLNKYIDIISKSRAEQFISRHKGWWYTGVNYSDNCLMEGGNIFQHIEHIIISDR